MKLSQYINYSYGEIKAGSPFPLSSTSWPTKREDVVSSRWPGPHTVNLLKLPKKHLVRGKDVILVEVWLQLNTFHFHFYKYSN